MSVALYPTRTRAPRGVRTSATSASPLRGPARVPLSSSVIFVSSTYFGWRGGDRVRAAHAATAREKKRARALSYLRLRQDAVGLAGRFAAPCRRMSRRHCEIAGRLASPNSFENPRRIAFSESTRAQKPAAQTDARTIQCARACAVVLCYAGFFSRAC